jgi:hypothetical protein
MAWSASKMDTEFSKATPSDTPDTPIMPGVPTAVYRRGASKRCYKMNDERDAFNIFLAWACGLLVLTFLMSMLGK